MDIQTLVDSGGYSAWKLGQRIDLDAYIGFVKSNEDFIRHYVNLDVIPGSFGSREWRPEEIEAAAAASYANQQKMKEAGLNPIPVVHQDESPRWVERYLADGERYIGLSLSQRAGRREKLTCLREWSKILCSQGRPLVRTHGLGETSALISHEFPFTSVDSTRWSLAAAYGQIPIPICCDGKPDYTLDPRIVSVGKKSSRRSSHIDMRDDRKRVDRFLEKVGVNAKQCCDDITARYKVWLHYLSGVEASSGVQIFHVTDMGRGQSAALDAAGIERRLVSYNLLRKRSANALAKYVGRACATRAR